MEPAPDHPNAREDERREELRRAARAFRPDADKLCPNCLYDISALCEHWEDDKACPECSRVFCPRLVCEEWISRSQRARLHELIWMFTGAAGGVLLPFGLFVLAEMDPHLLIHGSLVFMLAVGTAGVVLFMVLRSAFVSLRLHDPLKPLVLTCSIALGIGAANIVLFLIVAWMTTLFLLSVFL